VFCLYVYIDKDGYVLYVLKANHPFGIMIVVCFVVIYNSVLELYLHFG